MIKPSSLHWLVKGKILLITHHENLNYAIAKPCFEEMVRHLDAAHHKISFISDLSQVKWVSLDCNRLFRLPVLQLMMSHPHLGMHALVNAPSYIQVLVSMLGMFGRDEKDIVFCSSVDEAKKFLLKEAK